MLQAGVARRDADAAERLRAVRERLEATVSGLGELELLRQRQEELVRAALRLQEEGREGEEAEPGKAEEERRREAQLSTEEKLLEENILLLRKQLNCLRRRDTGLISQLQELDRQISNLRLDTEPSHDPPETDSRPSSGFFELSDGAFGSLSNSSNSVFSECFCLTTDTDGRLPSTDELVSCLDCDGLIGGFCDDSAFCGTVCRSLSAPHRPTASAPLPATADPAPSDSQSRFHCDLVARNGSEVYRYPSPLHAVAVQSPVFLPRFNPAAQSREAEEEAVLRSTRGPSVPQSFSWPAPFLPSSPSLKRLDGYISTLLQRRAPPPRTSRPRTSISTEPSKSVLRPVALCGRQLLAPCPGGGTMWGAELRPPGPSGGGAVFSSPQRQNDHILQAVGVSSDSGVVLSQRLLTDAPPLSVTQSDVTPHFIANRAHRPLPPPSTSTETLPTDLRDLGSSKDSSTPEETRPPCFPPDPALLLKSPLLTPPTSSPHHQQTGHAMMSVSGQTDGGVSSVGHGVPGGRGHVDGTMSALQGVRLSQRGNAASTVRTTSATLRNTGNTAERGEPSSQKRADRTHSSSKSRKSCRLEDGGSTHIRASQRAAGGTHGMSCSKNKRPPATIPEGQDLGKHATRSCRHHHGHRHHGHHHHHHHQGRDQVAVVAKPKYKRSGCRRSRATMELPYDKAFRRAQRRQRKEILRHSDRLMSSPYPYTAGSDSEYSAECASLFHSTIVDTSEDERSNYTTNRFGDSESSEDEYVEESASPSDTEESGAGVVGRGRGQVKTAGTLASEQEVCSAQVKAFVKIKASHTLKKRILRFRSGSLKLMTTV